MEEAERLTLNTTLPEQIAKIVVNAKFKAGLLSSEVLDENILDDLMEKNNGKDFVFKFVLKLRKANKPGSFSIFQEVLRETGQGYVADVLDAEIVRHRKRLKGTVLAGSSGGGLQTSEVAVERKKVAAEDQKLEWDGPGGVTSYPCRQKREPSVQDEEALKSELQQRLPPRGTSRALGDIVVPKDYYGMVYSYASGRSAVLPGPLPEIDCTVPAYPGFAYIPPDSCALLSRYVGGKPALVYNVNRGLSALRTIDSQVAYCKANVYADPGAIIKCTVWVSLKWPLGESLRPVTIWPEFEARCLDTMEEIDLSAPAEKWFSQTSSMGIKLSRKRATLENSASERRTIIKNLLQNGNKDTSTGHVVVTSVYGRHVTAFAAGQSEREPGPLQTINSASAAHNTHNVGFLPVEVCATLIEFYGGEATLVRGKESGCDSLTSMTRHIMFLPTLLRVHVSSESISTIGSFFFAVDYQLSDAIAAAIGWFPSRAQSSGVDLDLQMTVRQWFKTSKTTGIVLFNE